jgi:hypothetical protein
LALGQLQARPTPPSVRHSGSVCVASACFFFSVAFVCDCDALVRSVKPKTEPEQTDTELVGSQLDE